MDTGPGVLDPYPLSPIPQPPRMSRPHIRPEGDERWIYVAHRHWMALLLRSLTPLIIGLLVGTLLLWRVLGRRPDFLGQMPPILDALNVFLALVGLLMAAALFY